MTEPLMNIYRVPEFESFTLSSGDEIQRLKKFEVVQKTHEPVYQCFELAKSFEASTHEGKEVKILRFAYGLRYVQDDTAVNDSCLSRMIENAQQGRRIEHLMCVTMYDESPFELDCSLSGIARNLRDFQARGISWEQVACVIVVDGIAPMMKTLNDQQKNSKQFYEHFFNETQICDKWYGIHDPVKQLKSYEEKLKDQKRQNIVLDEDVCYYLEEEQEIAHLFMQHFVYEGANDDYPLQLILCVKHLNKRKLNSHLWFFGGFCELLQPRFVQLIDVGTRPLEHSIWRLYSAMAMNARLAGVCGEIRPVKPKFSSVVEWAQVVEYKFSHIFDKPLEACFGFITVLPGAFSAYR